MVNPKRYGWPDGGRFICLGLILALAAGPVGAQAVDLTVSEIQLAQVIYDPDIDFDGRIDLVLGKVSVALARITANGADPGDTRSVTVELADTGGVLSSASLILGEIPPAGTQVKLYFVPLTWGFGDLTVTVDPADAISEENEANNTIQVASDIKGTEPLRILHISIPDCASTGGCYGPHDDLSKSVGRSNQFIAATYPTSEFLYEGPTLPSPFHGSPINIQIFGTSIGVVFDILTIGIIGQLVTPQADKALGVVPVNYFDYHGMIGVVGITLLYFSGGLVAEGYWTASAHEVAHMYGIAEEEYITNPPGNPARGFWVLQQTPVENSHCFMGSGPLGNDNFDPSRGMLNRWVDEPHYAHLFRQLEVTDGTGSSAVLLVSGLLLADGQVIFGPWRLLPNREVTPSRPGDYSVRALDKSGQVLNQTSMPVTFAFEVEPYGDVPTAVVPFVVTIPLPDRCARVEMVHKKRVLNGTSPAVKLLADAVAALPDGAFVSDPQRNRRILHSRVKAIEHLAGTHASSSKLKAGMRDLRRSLKSSLADGRPKQQPLQMDKEEVLAVMDVISERLE